MNKQTLKDSTLIRWIVLVLLSGMTFGIYWFMDCMGPLKGLMESELGFSNSQFGLVISATTWANLALMIIVGGMALDRWGIRITGIVFALLATLGASMVALAAGGYFGKDSSTMLTYMAMGRLLFGIGLETVCVMVNRTVVKWFKGKELALAMAINMGFGRLGSAGTNFFGLDIAGGSVSAGLFFAAMLIGLGLIFFVIFLIIDVQFDRQLKSKVVVAVNNGFHFSDLVALITNRSFLLITLLSVTFYSSVFPFIQYAPDLLINKFGFTSVLPDLSGLSFVGKLSAYIHNGPKVTSFIPLGTILFTPIFGIFVDKKGRAGSLMILGVVLLIFAFITLSVLNNLVLGYMGLLSLGLAFSLVPASLWPSVAKIVPENRLGTAYSVMFTLQNYGLALLFWGMGKVLDMANPDVIAKTSTIRDGLGAQGLSSVQINEQVAMLKLSGEIPPYNYSFPILMLLGLWMFSIILAFQLKKAGKIQGYGLERPSIRN